MIIINKITKKSNEIYKYLDTLNISDKNRQYWKDLILVKANNVAFAIREWEWHCNRILKNQSDLTSTYSEVVLTHTEQK